MKGNLCLFRDSVTCMTGKVGFDHEKYIQTQSKEIERRISSFGGKLYMEFGGKLFDDYHASRVLPGFQPDSKVKMLAKMADDVEIVIVINAGDIENNKMRGDIGIHTTLMYFAL